jgi:phage protein D
MTKTSTPSTEAVFKAAPLLSIDGEIHDLLLENLVSLDVVEEAGGLSRCEALFANTTQTGDGAAALPFDEADSVLAFGRRLQVGLGDTTRSTEVFSGSISGLEAVFAERHEPRLRVLAEDELMAARVHRRSKTWPAGTLAALVRAVARDLGLQAGVDGCDQDVGVQVQLDESDLAFLRRVLARYDADCQVVAGRLEVSPRSRVRRAELRLDHPGALRSVRVLADLAHQVSTVAFRGFDAATGRAIAVASGAGMDLGPGTTGFTGREVLEHVFGERHEHFGLRTCANTAEAQAFVDAAAAARARRFVTVHATCGGEPRLRVGTHVTLTGIGPRFSGVAYVTRVAHRFDRERGYQCEFTAESARLGGGDE